jgi:hypothetical protein
MLEIFNVLKENGYVYQSDGFMALFFVGFMALFFLIARFYRGVALFPCLWRDHQRLKHLLQRSEI